MLLFRTFFVRQQFSLNLCKLICYLELILQMKFRSGSSLEKSLWLFIDAAQVSVKFCKYFCQTFSQFCICFLKKAIFKFITTTV